MENSSLNQLLQEPVPNQSKNGWRIGTQKEPIGENRNVRVTHVLRRNKQQKYCRKWI